MAGFTEAINRDAGTDPLVPEPIIAEVIKEMPQRSAVLSLARRVPMSTKTARQPVLSVLPEAFFRGGDSGLGETTSADWENLELVAEPIDTFVVIPEDYLDDSAIPIWSEVRPLITEAMGRRIDRTCLFNESRPSTWGEAVLNTAVAAGNTVVEGTGEDLAEEVAEMAQLVEEDGAEVSGFACAPGFRWRLRRLRSTDGVPIYSPPTGAQPGDLYGEPLPHIRNGGWFPTVASIIGGDWSKAVIGVRRDLEFRMFTEGSITDSNGVVVTNLMQQGQFCLRATARYGWQIANPVNPVNTTAATRAYFGAVTPATS